MTLYTVTGRVLGQIDITVEADSPEEAKRKALDGEWIDQDLIEYELLPENGCRGNVCQIGPTDFHVEEEA